MFSRHFAAAVMVSTIAFAARARAAGTFAFFPVTGDADSGIGAAKTYTHAVDFGAGGNSGGFPNLVDTGTTINGVPFHIGGPTGPGYTSTGLLNYIGTNPWTASVPAGENSLGDLLNDFYWRNTFAPPADQTLTLTGLTPGTAYLTTFYNAGWEAGRTRAVTVTASDGGSVTFDQNFTGHARPNVLRYAYVASGPSISYTFTPADAQNGFHQYGFTNEVVPEPTVLSTGGLAVVLLLRRRRPLRP